MAGFLQQLAAAILKEHGTDLQRVAVVLPSQRAGARLRSLLADQARAPFWSPAIHTLGTFMEAGSGLRVLPMEELLFEAYEAYRSVMRDAAQPIEEFLQWAPATLRDISEADAHLVPVEKFYRDLRNWEELDWSFNTEEWSAGQQRFNSYWTMAGQLHQALNARTLQQRAGSQGLVERTAAEKPIVPWSQVWFAGLNAFTTAQRAVIDHVHRDGLARFAWDTDAHYLNDLEEGAGLHVRAAIRRYGEGVVPPTASLKQRGERTTIISTATPIEQAWAAVSELRKVPREERDGTAIVLADTALLEPLLEALRHDDGPVNVTMGRNVASLPAGSLFQAFFQLLAGARDHAGYLRNDVERLLLHPFLRHANTDAALQQLAGYVHLRITEQQVLQLVRELGEHAHDAFDASRDMHARTLALIAWAHATTQGDPAADEQVYQAAIAVQRVMRAIQRHGHRTDAGLFARIMERALKQAQVGFFGEPLKGTQVMGLLETRALDLRRTIVIGCQEGKLPANTLDGSYIPFELRRAYRLPLRDETDAVQAYNFQRLLQHSAHITLLHPSGESADAPSRFITQMKHGLSKEETAPTTFSVRVPLPVRPTIPITINKDATWIERLEALLAKGVSPSALGTWLRCPLDFHSKYILRLKEPDAVDARIASRDLGDALHKTLEQIIGAFKNEPLHADQLLAAADGIPEQLARELQPRYTEADLREGQPLLQFGMAVRSARKFLRNEAERVQAGSRIVPLFLEHPLSAELGLSIPGLGTPVRLAGRADRIDDRDGIVHILDLKTGSVDERELDLKELGPDTFRSGKGFALQLLMYAWMYLQQHADVEAVRVGLLPLQRPSESEGLFLKLQGTDLIQRGQAPLIATTIAAVIADMANTTEPIQHDPRSRFCVFCAG